MEEEIKEEQRSIIEAGQLPADEKVYLKKDIFKQWTVVYPLKNEDGTWNWKNIITGGNWWSFILTIIFILIALGVFYEYHANLAYCENLIRMIVKV